MKKSDFVARVVELVYFECEDCGGTFSDGEVCPHCSSENFYPVMETDGLECAICGRDLSDGYYYYDKVLGEDKEDIYVCEHCYREM